MVCSFTRLRGRVQFTGRLRLLLNLKLPTGVPRYESLAK